MLARMNARIHAGEYVEFMEPKIGDKSQKVRKIIAPEVIMSGSHQRPSTSSSGPFPRSVLLVITPSQLSARPLPDDVN
jgi:hypothetical protein